MFVSGVPEITFAISNSKIMKGKGWLLSSGIFDFIIGIVLITREDITMAAYALVFGLLFAFFAVLTHFVISNFGKEGINLLSLIVGVTDIDPYILNLFQNINSSITVPLIVSSTIIAAASNNFVKMLYALILGNKEIKKQVILGFSLLIVLSFIVVIF